MIRTFRLYVSVVGHARRYIHDYEQYPWFALATVINTNQSISAIITQSPELNSTIYGTASSVLHL